MINKVFLLLVVLGGVSLGYAEETRKALRAGIVGLDTSHVPAFTKLFNDPKAEGDLAGIRVVAGYPGGTDMPASRDRVAKFTEQVRQMGVEIVASIPELMAKVDVVLLESVDGRIHLQEAQQIFQAGKPVFIDKPVAGSLADALMIYELAAAHHVPCFSSSSSRFNPDLEKLVDDSTAGETLGALTWGPLSYQPGTPDMFFYGVHGIEALFTLMGTGCVSVSRVQGTPHDQVTGQWKDGRLGTYRGLVSGKSETGAVLFGSRAILHGGTKGSYEPLCRQIGRFFRTGQPPVSPEETLEIFTFMEAADESLRQGGRPVMLAEILAKAKEEVASRKKQP